MNKVIDISGKYSGICQGGVNFFFFPGGHSTHLGPETPMKSIDFTGPGGHSTHLGPENGVVTVRPITFHPITFDPKRFTQF